MHILSQETANLPVRINLLGNQVFLPVVFLERHAILLHVREKKEGPEGPQRKGDLYRRVAPIQVERRKEMRGEDHIGFAPPFSIYD